MTDQDASPEHLHPSRAVQPSSTPDHQRTPRSSHDMAGAGAESSLSNTTTTTPSPTGRSPSAQKHARQGSLREDERRRRGAHRSHKQRSGGAFLLSDGIFNAPNQEPPSQISKRIRNSSDAHDRSKPGRHGQDKSPRGDTESAGGEGVGLGLGLGFAADSPSRAENKSGPAGSTALAVPKRDSLTGDTVVGSSPRTSLASLDMESAQIVNMALNLSESRRLASRRNITTPAPPRLAPLPDSTTGGSLRQHLQQQRRVSRTISPKPDRTPRIGSGRVLSPLQPGYDPDGSYRYHFSQSTLARAQKAKEYIELMAQYRRVLELLPPLIPSRTARSSIVSPPDSPNDSVQSLRLPTNDHGAQIGRPYNPLQYVRNRKVRARERKAIDGEAQGFKDVPKVSEWVDEVAKWVATGQSRAPGNTALPRFGTADLGEGLNSPSSTANKPKRPRVDWVVEPADVIADVYWLEQDGNKRLVEDRHWKRVFPQNPDPLRPISRDDFGPVGPLTTTPISLKESPSTITPVGTTTSDAQIAKSEHEHVFTSARDRAQQKLRALKGSHHRQNSSINGRDFLRIHRGSLSESSDTDSDRRRRARNGTISSTGKDILAKQMAAIIAREQRDAESHPLYDHDALHMKFDTGSATPERERPGMSRNPSRLGRHKRTDSRADLSETENRHFRFKRRPSPPPAAAGRASLEVPTSARGRRFSIDYDTSQPNSPDLRAVRDNTLVPAIGMDLSPMSSTPGSPSRNPLTKVKSVFRERSRNRAAEMHLSEVEDNSDIPIVPLDKLVDLPRQDRSTVASPERRSSRSPLRKVVSRGTDASHKSYRSTGSGRLRDDGQTGLRSLFRGPRIDSVLRSGVSKVSDIIWRKDTGGGGDDPSTSTSSDESDMDQARGRPASAVFPLRQSGDRRTQDTSGQSGKSYLEVMPHFVPTSENSKSASSDHPSLMIPETHPTSRPLSRRSSRFELLKPPRLDVQSASPTSSPPEAVRGSEASDSDTRRNTSEYTESVRAADARLNAALQFSTTSQWPLTERGGVNPSQGTSTATGVVSKREIARLRAYLLSTGIHAMEMDRRAKERKLLASPKITSSSTRSSSSNSSPSPLLRPSPPPPPTSSPSLPWGEIATLCPDPVTRSHLLSRPTSLLDIYPLAARVLGQSIQTSAQQWSAASDRFAAETAPQLEHRAEWLRGKLGGELTDLARSAAEEADEAYTDLVTGQRLKVKRVGDFIERMGRRRRRRFRWVRRLGWLAVEWALVGFMWYVWFVVMITRVVLAVGRGVVRVGRWLVWL